VPVWLTVQEQEAKASLNHPGGQEVMNRVGGDKAGLPFFAFLDEKGALIVNSLRPGGAKGEGENIGHPIKPEEVDWFMIMVKKTAPGISQEEAGVLERWLRSQKR
jgi:hypothetical protein